MSFGGSVAGMIRALKDNKSLLGKTKERYFKSKKNGIYTKSINEELEFKIVSEVELKVIKNRIRKKLKKERYKNYLVLLICTVLSFFILRFLFTLIIKNM